jgi:L-ascorbate metabolism protein UlaG (beta-lactamase superfamily)
MKITWMTQGSFLFESKGLRIIADPYMSDCLEAKGVKRMQPYPLSFEELKPDMLLCTHDHLDHLDPETVEKIGVMYPDCVFAGPVSCCRHFTELGIDKSRQLLLTRGQAVNFRGIKIIPVFAKHSDPEAVGAVFETDGKKLYLSGDSEYSDNLFSADTRDCYMLLICINGRLGNMNIDDALRVVDELKPQVALPMHYGLFAENTVAPQPFIDGCTSRGVKSFEMQTGKGFEL